VGLLQRKPTAPPEPQRAAKEAPALPPPPETDAELASAPVEQAVAPAPVGTGKKRRRNKRRRRRSKEIEKDELGRDASPGTSTNRHLSMTSDFDDALTPASPLERSGDKDDESLQSSTGIEAAEGLRTVPLGLDVAIDQAMGASDSYCSFEAETYRSVGIDIDIQGPAHSATQSREEEQLKSFSEGKEGVEVTGTPKQQSSCCGDDWKPLTTSEASLTPASELELEVDTVFVESMRLEDGGDGDGDGEEGEGEGEGGDSSSTDSLEDDWQLECLARRDWRQSLSNHSSRRRPGTTQSAAASTAQRERAKGERKAASERNATKRYDQRKNARGFANETRHQHHRRGGRTIRERGQRYTGATGRDSARTRSDRGRQSRMRYGQSHRTSYDGTTPDRDREQHLRKQQRSSRQRYHSFQENARCYESPLRQMSGHGPGNGSAAPRLAGQYPSRPSERLHQVGITYGTPTSTPTTTSASSSPVVHSCGSGGIDQLRVAPASVADVPHAMLPRGCERHAAHGSLARPTGSGARFDRGAALLVLCDAHQPRQEVQPFGNASPRVDEMEEVFKRLEANIGGFSSTL